MPPETAAPNDILARHQAASETARGVRAEAAPWRPPSGRYHCDLTGITIAEPTFNYNKPAPGGKIKAFSAQPRYRCHVGTEFDGKLWAGKFRIFPSDDLATLEGYFGPRPDPDELQAKSRNEKLTDGESQWIRIFIAQGQWKGFLAVAQGVEEDLAGEIDLVAGTLALINTLNTDGVLPVEVEARYEKDDKERFDRDRLLRVLDVG